MLLQLVGLRHYTATIACVPVNEDVDGICCLPGAPELSGMTFERKERIMGSWRWLLAASCVALAARVSISADCDATAEKVCQTKDAGGESKSEAKPKWIELFDGKTLKNWEKTEFGGEGEVAVQDGQIVMGMGADLTGITWKDKEGLPLINYEVNLEAKRIDGTDFFCALTFPVKEDPCTLVLGGWGGGLCGLSSIDGMDASENETTTFQEFKDGRWYHIRLRVTDRRIQAWIDKERIVDQDITNCRLSVRIEVELSRPFGIASWQTSAALRNIRVRSLSPAEIAKSGP